MALGIMWQVSMPGPEICDPQELSKPVITHFPLYNFLTFISSSVGTVNGVGGELSLGRSTEAPERRNFFAGEGEVEVGTADVVVLEGPEAIGKNLKSGLRSNSIGLAQPRHKSV